MSDVSIRLGKGIDRLILMTDLPMAYTRDMIPNLDADMHVEERAIMKGMMNPFMRLRCTAISGYGPYAKLDPGLKRPLDLPRLSIMGLDIEVMTIRRGGRMPLLHDEIVSIAITNGGWYDKEFLDKCFCIYSVGHCSGVEWDLGRQGILIRVGSSEEAAQKAYEVLNTMSPNLSTYTMASTST